MSSNILPPGAKALHNFPVPSRPRTAAKGAAVVPCLSAKDISALSKAREGRWRPGLVDQPLHSEIFASMGDASGAGLALALARDALKVAAEAADPLAEPDDRRQVLWVQDKRAVQRSGRPYVLGLPTELRHRLIHVETETPEDALFALEEGLRCRDLACVIGEIVGNPRALDFTASRRLSLAAEKHNVALWLVRLEAAADLSSARMRWRVEAAPSAAPRWNAAAPGASAWKAELFRARSHAPGKWTVNNDNGNLSAKRLQQAANIAAKDGAEEGAPGAQDIGHLVRQTFGRSLAAVARG